MKGQIYEIYYDRETFVPHRVDFYCSEGGGWNGVNDAGNGWPGDAKAVLPVPGSERIDCEVEKDPETGALYVANYDEVWPAVEAACQNSAKFMSEGFQFSDDQKKRVRRRIEDALRKTATEADLRAIAARLGCRTD
jgi:hypothetical protein